MCSDQYSTATESLNVKKAVFASWNAVGCVFTNYKSLPETLAANREAGWI